MDLGAAVEEQIEQWRGYVRRRRAISPAYVDELEDHLRASLGALRDSGLEEDEAFLVAIRRLGNLDAVSREFAREHSERLWKQLALVPDDVDGRRAARHELGVVLALAVGAGAAVRLGMSVLESRPLAVLGVPVALGWLLLAPFPAAYLGWKRRIGRRAVLALLVPYVALAVVLTAYPFEPGGTADVLATLHAPVVLWLLIGVAYLGGRWRSAAGRMDFVRFTGELVIYYTLLALGGGVLVALTGTMVSLVGVDPENVIAEWLMPFAVPGAFVVAAWLVEAKQNVVENIAPVLTRVFTPITLAMLVAVLGVLVTGDRLTVVDRDLLILMDAILLLVLCLLLYSLSARDPLAAPGPFDTLQLLLVVVALAVDAVMLAAMLSRIAEFGWSANKVAALGLNLLLAVHLAGTAWLSAGFLRRRRPFAALERWQTAYLPVYATWAAVVVVVFPLVFGFA